MPKKKRKITAHMRAFGRVAKAANRVCHAATSTVSAYKKCMSKEMKAGLGKKKGKGPKKITCVGLVKSGPRKGKLKKGYTYKGAKGRCPRKAG